MRFLREMGKRPECEVRGVVENERGRGLLLDE